MSRLAGRCRACHLHIYLKELVRAPFLEGDCPKCGRPLAADQAPLMLRTAARCVRAHDELVDSVRTLVGLPGTLELIPHTLFGELLEDIDWRAEIGDDQWLVRLEIGQLERHLRAWTQLAEEGGTVQRSEVRAGLGRLARLLRRRADRIDARDPPRSEEAAALEAAAARMDELAQTMGRP
jgi:hypothetical protein